MIEKWTKNEKVFILSQDKFRMLNGKIIEMLGFAATAIMLSARALECNAAVARTNRPEYRAGIEWTARVPIALVYNVSEID